MPKPEDPVERVHPLTHGRLDQCRVLVSHIEPEPNLRPYDVSPAWRDQAVIWLRQQGATVVEAKTTGELADQLTEHGEFEVIIVSGLMETAATLPGLAEHVQGSGYRYTILFTTCLLDAISGPLQYSLPTFHWLGGVCSTVWVKPLFAVGQSGAQDMADQVRDMEHELLKLALCRDHGTPGH